MGDPLGVLSDDQRQDLPQRDHPRSVDPMLAVLTDDRFSDPGWIFERKLDGVRLLIHRNGDGVRIRSRNDKDLNGAYPELVDAIAAQSCDDFVVDGEVVTFDGNRTSFSRLQGRMQLRDPQKARASGIAVFLYLFDVVHVAGRDVTSLPLRERKKVLRRVIDLDNPLRLSTHRNEDGEAYWREACDRGWEGLIAKRADAPYTHGRSKDWLKFKCVNEQEVVIGGFTDPKGGRIGFGALLVGVHEREGELLYAGKVGAGYDDQTLEDLRSRLDSLERKTPPFADPPRGDDVHWVTPELVAQVGFSEWTHDHRLRHPTFLGLRTDKDPQDVVRERPRSVT